MEVYITIYLGSTLLALMVTPIVIWGALRVNLVDIPVTRSLHIDPVPRVGGVSIFASMMCITALALFLPGAIRDRLGTVGPQVAVLLAAATFMFGVGLIDDVRTLRARNKLLGQLAAAIAVCAMGIRIETVAVADWFTLEFGWFSWPLTILWIVGISNAVNLSDGMDGLAAGISAVACGVIAILALYSAQPALAVLMIALVGSLTGFLCFNFNPAKIFMGDSGSLFLGFTIAVASILCLGSTGQFAYLALPTLSLGIPILDTLSSMLRRFLERRSLFAPDRNHFHHRLLGLGLTQRYAALLVYGVTLLAVALGSMMIIGDSSKTIICFPGVLLVLLLVFRAAGSVRFRATIYGLQKRVEVSRQMKAEIAIFEKSQLRFRQAKTSDDWWRAVCEAAEELGLLRVGLRLKGTDDACSVLSWHKGQKEIDSPGHEGLMVSFHDGESHSGLQTEIAMATDGSLESAGRRVALFNRLLDENPGVDLQPSSRRPTKFASHPLEAVTAAAV